MKGASGSLKLYISVLNLCSNRNIDYHKDHIVGMHGISIKLINLKLN